MAALAALALFSMMPAAASCKPRCAIGRAVSQSQRDISPTRSGDLEHALDFDRGVERQPRDAHCGAGVAALVAKHVDDQVGGTIHDFRPVEKTGNRADE